nr:programmed cell death 6-interacting protein isoform X1 [Halyomorpha halys]
MAELLAVPLKKPSPDVEIVKPLVNLIASTYSTADKPQDYSEQINEFAKLRSNALLKVFEKYESSLEVIYSYYDQVQALESKIPPQDIQIPFKWKDAFNKGGLFGGRISLTISSLAYEKVCVLFNIAALQSAIAASQSLEQDEGLKLAAKLLQQASGIFAYLKNNVISAIQVEPTPDLNPETLGALSLLLLAQAQEVFVHKAIYDCMKEGITAKLCSQCNEYYAEALSAIQRESVRQFWDREWVPLVAGKQSSFAGLAHYFQSIVCKQSKEVGEEIARLQKAVELLKAGQTRSGRPTLFQDYVNKAERALVEAHKDNDFIYHERIPDPKFLAPIPRAALAKQMPLPQHLSHSFKDLFQDLVPMPVHQAVAAYEVRKSELVNREINELRKATQLLNGVLSSLNLPAALEETSGETVPQSLAEKAQAVMDLGGIRKLQSMISELPVLLQRNTEILNEAERMLDEEQASDEQLKEQFKERWNRIPSTKLTDSFRTNIAKYREIINNAISADKIIKDKFDTHERGMSLLSEGVEVMRASLPSPAGASRDTPASHRLRRLMEEVETLKAERDTIEMELKSSVTDMKETFLMSLAQGGSINEPVMSTEALGRVYGPLQQQVKDSIAKQQRLLESVQEANLEFSGSGNEGISAKRESALKELAAAHDAFKELQNNLSEGTKFYNDLTQILVAFQNKVSDFCFARKTEKDELLRDLTQEMSRGSSAPTPAVPTHHASVPPSDNSEGTKKTPPPRPPPPTKTDSSKKTAPPRPPPPQMQPGSSHTLPYPTQPAMMPMPFAQAGTAPYPGGPYIAMPAGYNPYATIAGYPHHPPPGGYYPMQYGQFPPAQQQQPPPQQQSGWPPNPPQGQW